MKVENRLNEIIPAETLALAFKLLSLEDSSFEAMVEIAGFDPSFDFQHCDLFGVDFTNSNLRGYNFSGADLRGATGLNVKWDATTILVDALTTGSLFAHAQARDRFMSANPNLAEQVDRLNKDYWAKTIVNVADLLATKNKKVDEKSLWVAKALFDTTNELPIRSNILFFMKPALDDAAAHRDFLYNTLAQHQHEPSILIAAIRTLTSLYSQDIGTTNILLACLHHKDARVRREALKGVMTSSYVFRKRAGPLLNYVNTVGDSAIRREFLGRLARTLGEKYVRAVVDQNMRTYIDYHEEVTWRSLLARAEIELRVVKFEEMSAASGGRNRQDLEGALKLKQALIEDRADEYLQLLRELKQTYKIPFVFQK